MNHNESSEIRAELCSQLCVGILHFGSTYWSLLNGQSDLITKISLWLKIGHQAHVVQ